MRKRILFLCLTLAAGLLHAQDDEQQKINAIKSNVNYLYATGTSKTNAEEASENAKALLALEIEQWLKENAEDVNGYAAKSREHLSQIQTQRGSLYRAFVFVKKKDVLPYYKEEEVMVVDFATTPPVVQQKEDTLSSRTTPEAVTTVVSETKIQERTEAAPPVVVKESPVYIPTAREKSMLEIKTFNALNEFINKGREDENIMRVGNYANLPQTGTVYVFIHNRQGEIPACIKLADGRALKLSTGKEDRIADYKGCGVIWVKFKNE